MSRLHRSRFIHGFLALGVAAMLLAPIRAESGNHCAATPDASIGASAAASSAHHAMPPAGASQDNGDAQGCPHCPVAQCPTQTSCSIQPAILAAAAVPSLVAVQQYRVGRPAIAAGQGLSHSPPTPPPQLLA